MTFDSQSFLADVVFGQLNLTSLSPSVPDSQMEMIIVPNS